ncbi:DUF493 domain-containing protein [Aestuariirhabdus litorea]|uniref:DUF493 domain-containing protein n=2 Tax=Aestuariirhabdus litorea TaxID=2528527 RepID=A0A3P3VUT6_9GAMM|nr:DUF493 domain-containing protein [Aestuariirhabdus litorea]RWW98610.1 DUF493 family protein [Endozoicomonadaceae bacterium GTF-13]
MGEAEVDFIEFVLEVITRHDSSFDGQHEVKTSRNGRYHSVTVVITATGEVQLKALHQELMGSGRVKMVL